MKEHWKISLVMIDLTWEGYQLKQLERIRIQKDGGNSKLSAT